MSKKLALITLILVAAAQAARATTYIVVFKGTESATGFEVGGSNLLNLDAALGAVTAAGGVVTSDLTKQMGVAIASSANALFADLLLTNPLVEEVGRDFAFTPFDGDSDTPVAVDASDAMVPGEDPLAGDQPVGGHPYQWGMFMIDAPAARDLQPGNPAVTVALLDSGVDPMHQDFFVGLQSNIDVARARSFAIGTANPLDANPLVDTIGHGTRMAGIIAARKNGLGIIGVAPDVTIVPIKVTGSAADPTTDDIRLSWVLAALGYAGEIGADVVNMSFAIDATDEESRAGNEPTWCRSQDRFVRKSLERAIHYVRSRGGLPVAAAGNGDAVGDDGVGDDLSQDDDCDVLPAETPGVVTVSGLDTLSALTTSSNYGTGAVALAAPSGYGDPTWIGNDGEGGGYACGGTLTTSPGNSYACTGGTSSATPHVSGVAALIVSEFGKVGPDGDIKVSPAAVEDLLYGSAIDIGTPDDDECYGVGRVDAYRAVNGDTTYQSDPTATACLVYPPPPTTSDPCAQIVDGEGDAALYLSEYRPNLDILSAAFTAASSGDLRITLTIKDLTGVPPQTVPASNWSVYFDSGGTRYIVQANGSASSPDTVTYTAGPFETDSTTPFGYLGTEDGFDAITLNDPITGSFTPGPNGTIVFDVPRERIGSPADGALLTNLVVYTYDSAGGFRGGYADRGPDSAYGTDYAIGTVCASAQ